MALNIKKLLVSQPKPASEKSPYFDIAEKYGVEIDFRPFIKVEPLSSKEFRQQKAVMYRTVSNDFSKDEKFDYDMLVFFSPSGISSLLKNFPNFKQEDIKIGCFGPTTAKAVKEAGLRLDVEAPTPEAPSMTAALELYLKKEMGSNKKNGK